MKDTLVDAIDHAIQSINCVTLEETLAEKWIALLRRISNIEHGNPYDHTLIRHLYDIHKLVESITINDKFIALINKVISNDREQYKNKNLSYYQNTFIEMKRSIQSLSTQKQ